MAVNVSWGTNHPLYDKSEVDYNSPISVWRRYSENIKRGYVLSFSVKYPNKSPMCADFGCGLIELEYLRNDGIGILYKLEQKNVSEKTLKRKIKSLMKEVIDSYGSEYHNWGMNGDEYSPSNNPFSNIN